MAIQTVLETKSWLPCEAISSFLPKGRVEAAVTAGIGLASLYFSPLAPLVSIPAAMLGVSALRSPEPPPPPPPLPLEEKKIDVLPINRLEEGFSAFKYLAIATLVAVIAGVILSHCMPAAIILFLLASWYLYSSAIIVANRAAENTCLARPIHYLHAAAMELNAGISSALLFPFTLFKTYHAPQGNLRERPILLVNGYLSYGSTWHYQRQKLVEAGLGPVYTMNVGSGGSITTYAKHVQAKVKEIQQETGRNDLILIGHSKGGLVISHYATSLAHETGVEITDIVTIGSPLGGTPVAYLGLGYDAAEMRTGSSFHVELREKIKQHTHKIRFSHIGSEADEVVPITSSLIGEDQTRHYRLKDIGHLGLVFSSRVADQVCDWLKPSP